MDYNSPMPKCQLCKETFAGQEWMRYCLQCYKANQFKLASKTRRRKLEEGARLAAAVDARRAESRRAWRALPDPRYKRS